MTKDQITELQQNLTRLGYLTKIDGIFGHQTLKNLMAFQSDNGLESVNLTGLYGPVTKAKMEQLVNQIAPPDPMPVSNSETPWMDWMMANRGEKEIPGDQSNPFIMELFRYTSLAGNPDVSDDSKWAWCAALACAALEKNRYTSPRSAAAAAFDKFGEPSTLKYGAFCVLKRKDGGRHVTFYHSTIPDGRIWCLGGNQSDSLNLSLYSATDVIWTGWPKKRT